MHTTNVADVLTSLGAAALAESGPVLSLDQIQHHLGSEAITIVGRPTVQAIESLVAVNPQTRLGLVVPLDEGAEGRPRAAASGFFSGSAHEVLDQAGITYLGEEVHLAATFHVIEQAMWANNAMIAGEAFKLAKENGVNLQLLYHALANGAAGSQAFRWLWPSLMAGDAETAKSTIHKAQGALAAGLALASKKVFYAPLMGLAKQATYEHLTLGGDHNAPPPAVEELTAEEPKRVGFVGLGAMGRPMSLVLHNSGVNVVGFDVWDKARDAYAAAGGKVASSILDSATGTDVLVLIVVNGAQVEDILFAQGALAVLADDAVILVMSTVPASEVCKISARVKSVRSDVSVVDCPVSGAVPRAATGDLMVFCGGLEMAGRGKGRAYRVLRLLSSSQGHPEYLVRVPGGVGRGASVKLSNQHLAGSQISCVAEIQALVAKCGIPGRKAHALLMAGPGWAWVLGHRGVAMLNGHIQPPSASINIFVKDMSIVVTEAGVLGVPVPIAALVQQQFIFASSLGWGGDDDSGLVRVWQYAGVEVACTE